MDAYTRAERARYNSYRDAACKGLSITKNQYNHLRRQALRLTQLDTESCNGDISDEEYEKSLSDTLIRIDRYGLPLGLFFYHQTDPRGLALYASAERTLWDSDYSSGYPIY